jgi:hypothetical protein
MSFWVWVGVALVVVLVVAFVSDRRRRGRGWRRGAGGDDLQSRTDRQRAQGDEGASHGFTGGGNL